MDLEWKWQQENNELRKALMYYADRNNYKLHKFSGVRRITVVEADGGKVARKALEELNSGFNHGKHAAGE